MLEFSDCYNAVREIEIRLDKDGEFIITSDWCDILRTKYELK
jgi:hypothetical protein